MYWILYPLNLGKCQVCNIKKNQFTNILDPKFFVVILANFQARYNARELVQIMQLEILFLWYLFKVQQENINLTQNE